LTDSEPVTEFKFTPYTQYLRVVTIHHVDQIVAEASDKAKQGVIFRTRKVKLAFIGEIEIPLP